MLANGRCTFELAAELLYDESSALVRHSTNWGPFTFDPVTELSVWSNHAIATGSAQRMGYGITFARCCGTKSHLLVVYTFVVTSS